MDWLRKLQASLAWLVVTLLVIDLSSGPTNYPSHVAHMVLGGLLALNILPSTFSSLLLIYMGAIAFTVPAKPSQLLNVLWNVYKFGSLLLGVPYFFLSAGRVVGGACGVVAVALIAQVILMLVPFFSAEDILPRLADGQTPVETPEIRRMYCNDALMRDRIGLICGKKEPLSWDEAEQQAQLILNNMTAFERHTLMQGTGWTGLPRWLPAPLPGFPRRGYYMGNTAPIPRLGVPALKLHDAGNGFRNMPYPLGKLGTTIMWPCSLAFGATWDAGLIEQVAEAIAREYRGKGANVLLGPSVQVHRVARNGRNFEYMSGEDPYLGSKLSAAYVRGVQGQGVIACLKHYGFNEQETRRSDGNSVVDEQTAWELYYPPFEAGIEAGAGAVMCSYNKINGTYACANEELLARDLKLKMKFRGFVMTDWWALRNPPEMSLVRGLDQEMPGAGGETFFYSSTLQSLEASKGGDLKSYLGFSRQKIYTDPAFRILASAWKMNLFNRPSCTPGVDCLAAIESDQRSEDNDYLAIKVATESVILLQNDGTLPITTGTGTKTIALIGSAMSARSYSTEEIGMGGDYYSGGGSGHCYVPSEQLVTPFERLKERATALGLNVLSSTSNNITEAMTVAANVDINIILAATTAEEGKDRESLSLDDNADELISAVVELGKPVVVLLQVPGTVLLPWREKVSAVALMFLGGENAGLGWAANVFGDVSPSGKLPIMIPKSMQDVIEPSDADDVVYSEGLFTSYRSKDSATKSAFPFGHGLSYTTFTFGSPKLLSEDSCSAKVCVQVSITNTGQHGFAGAEVAQAYVEFPPETEEPKIVLRGFHKTSVLPEGSTELAVFNFTERDFSIYRHGTWQLQKTAILHFGSSSIDLKHQISVEVPV